VDVTLTESRELESFDIHTLLSLDDVGPDRFHGYCHAGSPGRIFGGHLAAQGLTAAGRTVPATAVVHSLHGYFLSSGDPRQPITYEVGRLRDGRTYWSRQVTALQLGTPIFTLSVSFKLPEDSTDRQGEMPVVPAPEDLPDPYERWASARADEFRDNKTHRAMDMRFVADEGGRERGSVAQSVWFKPNHAFPDEPLFHAGVLTYASDLSLASTASLDVQPHRSLMVGPSRVLMASLDHAIWFHRPFRADEWMLFAQESNSATDGRGFSTGHFWTRDGVLAATVAQESLLRRVDGPPWPRA